MRSSSKFLLCALLLLVLFAAPVAAQATTSTSTPPDATPAPRPDLPINPNLPSVPGTVPISGAQGQGPAGLVANFYTYAFLLAGFLAFGMIVYGGVRYTFSAGSHSAQSDAKDAIKQALLGLALLLVAYMILRTINPDLTNLKLPTLDPYVPPPATATITSPDGGISCGEIAISPLAPDSVPFENGATLSFVSSNPRVQENLDYLKEQWINALVATAEDPLTQQLTLTANSAYRPISYQRHFHQIFLADRAFKSDPSLAAECPEMKAEVDREMRHHGLGDVVSAPSCDSPHVRGTAIDIGISGVSEENKLAAYTAISMTFEDKGIDLVWQKLPGDEFHFNTRKSPFRNLTACE